MRITADTNLLVRIIARDDEEQARIAYKLFSSAERVAVSLPCICEVVWVLRSVFKFSARDLAIAVQSILESGNTAMDRFAVETGLRILAAGGDFSDGVIAAAGTSLGGEVFVSFDRKAVARVNALGLSARDAAELA